MIFVRTRPRRLGCDLWRLQPDGVHRAEAASTAGTARCSLRRNPGCGRLRRPWHSLKRLLAIPRRYLADLFSCAEASHQSGPVSVSVSVSPAAIITKTDLDGIVCFIGALSLLVRYQRYTRPRKDLKRSRHGTAAFKISHHRVKSEPKKQSERLQDFCGGVPLGCATLC